MWHFLLEFILAVIVLLWVGLGEGRSRACFSLSIFLSECKCFEEGNPLWVVASPAMSDGLIKNYVTNSWKLYLTICSSYLCPFPKNHDFNNIPESSVYSVLTPTASMQKYLTSLTVYPFLFPEFLPIKKSCVTIISFQNFSEEYICLKSARGHVRSLTRV